ncbi:MAG: FdtA/QdtA family cupin domain-containing protein [archaeon]
MAEIIFVKTFADKDGKLTVIDKVLPFEIKRVFYIHDVKGLRGGHRHKKTMMALISVSGSCEIFVNDGSSKKTFLLDSLEKVLLLNPKDWHTMQKFSKGAVLMVLASTHYDKDDYIDEGYDD